MAGGCAGGGASVGWCGPPKLLGLSINHYVTSSFSSHVWHVTVLVVLALPGMHTPKH